MLMQEMLKAYGPTHVAANGREAVAAVCAALDAGDPYKLICLDIMMPEMNGRQALKEIRAQEQWRGIAASPQRAKIVMTTALDDIDNVLAAFKNQCDAYVVKPVHTAKLLGELHELGLID